MDLKTEITKIFRGKVFFSFICGSYVYNKSPEMNDVDIFCCVSSFDKKQEQRFRELYFSFHQKMNAKPDTFYPGELMTLKELESRLKLTASQDPEVKIKDRRVYDGLIWAGMIVDDKEIILREIPERISSLASSCIKKWNKKLFGEETISTKKLSEETIYDDEILLKAETILSKIEENKKLITEILLEVEPYETIEDEFFRSIDCLKNIKTEEGFLNSSRVDYISAFFPVNLPLYSLIIFGFVPSLMAKRIFIRPPEVIAPVIKK